MTALAAFDPNSYRKRVLAAVLARGGPEASDPFELYDLPPDVDLPDSVVAARLADVWGAWQRQRDHPKYRVLVAQLVDGHDARVAELLDGDRRRTAAARVRAQREQRDAARSALLDAAVSRLVARHGGVPADKVEGLHEIGALGGLSRAEVEVRLRRHRVLAPTPEAAPAGPAVAPERRRQVRALLDEFGRLSGGPAPATLLALLDAGPGSGREEIAARAAAWRSRARELPPTRLRTVVDELLVHVAELLEPGRAAVDVYLDAVALDVAEHVRPRMRAAVLVEDRLVAEDHGHLLDAAVALGLDRPRALALLAAVAAELGTTIEDGPAAPTPPVPRPPAPARPWEEPLRAARAALRSGRPRAAAGHVAQAQRLAGDDGARPVRAVADEVDAVLAEAGRRSRAARAAAAARRWVEAGEHLDHVARTATDAADPGADDLLDRARREVAAADAAVAAAPGGPGPARAVALAAVLEACPDHPGATAALAALPVAPPARVRAARDPGGDVVVAWEPPAGAAGAVYRVARVAPDGRRQVVGRVADTTLRDGGAPPGRDVPVYAVEVLLHGRASVPTRSDATGPPGKAGPIADGAGPPPRVDPPGRGVDPPRDVRAERSADGSVTVTWTGPADAEFRVRCRRPDGGWRVVGRTRARALADGGAPPGPVPEYAVSASTGGVRSAEAATT